MPLSKIFSTLFWIVWISYAALIIFFSSGDPPTVISPYPDKLLHLVCYAVFELLLLNALSRGFKCHVRVRILTLSMIFVVIFAVTDELHQWFVPGRHASTADLAADIIGGVSGLIVFILITRLLHRIRERGDSYVSP